MHFANATKLEVCTDSKRRYSGEIKPGWDILGNANGGYTMAMFARAALMASERCDVISVSAHFLSPGVPGPITVDVDAMKDGKRFATSRVDLGSSERTMLTGTVITGDLDDGVGPELITAAPPNLPPPDECVRSEPSEFFPPPFVGQIDQRIDPATALGTKPVSYTHLRGPRD